MSEDNDIIDDIIGIGLGILGGVALAEFLKGLSKKKCQRCNNYNEYNREFCKFCGGQLQ